jgi:hypothetical protein
MLRHRGASPQLPVPGADSYAGYRMAASGFLALAHTFKGGEHIRVTLVLERGSGIFRKSSPICRSR